MKIWIDLSAAPDPYFFRPIIESLKRRGQKVLITSRDFSETVAIARHCRFQFEVVGRNGDGRLLDKFKCTWLRTFQLARLARKHRPDVAVSFNSYSQGLAAKFLGIRFVTFMDYEYHPLTDLAFCLADDVVLPAGYDAAMLSKQSGQGEILHRFEGLKEDIAVSSFIPDAGTEKQLALLGINSSQVLVTVRPPPDNSCYHRFDNELFYQVLSFVAGRPKVKILYLPRNGTQLEKAKALRLENLVPLPFFMDGHQLVYHSDLVISAGGSMNREAVALGIPAYTTFKGRMAGVDKVLIESGQLKQIRSPHDFPNIAVQKCRNRRPLHGNPALVERFTDIICTNGS
ncbi:DUF354 domain-containing protein [Geomonas oryzisoli]|uniref:DUF354 domain-containing protein n=1 Tax=Geomonas oryzisoli TaxID=2847992 RepID=A0ABX8J6J9_9BACT|nr:DUF354 domain-containing protein [Geomonas oryzisoli]QWV93950.1 DUF354 domain-containing protein [Geomonas oryzisoli]